MLKKIIKVVVIAFVLLFLVCLMFVAYYEISSKIPLQVHRDKISKIINKKYGSYEIESLELEYVDWSSTVREAEEGDRPTSATVLIKNNEEQRKLHFEKEFFGWKMTYSDPLYGKNVPNGIYYIDVDWHNVGKLIDIEECMRNNWVMPYDGEMYSKVGDDEDWYYSYKVCENIYKTMDGYVYVFNKEISDWEKSEESYADMEYYGNYDRIEKSYAAELLKKYSGYEEK